MRSDRVGKRLKTLENEEKELVRTLRQNFLLMDEI